MAEVEVERILVEEDEDQLSVITVINLDTWSEIAKTLYHMHILQSTRSRNRGLSPTSFKMEG
jgi:hypothetical protein